MTSSMLTTACVVLVAIAAQPATAVSKFGRVGELLLPNHIDGIQRAVGSARLLAVEADWEQVLPEAWLVFAYLSPESELQGVRQGRIIDLRALVKNERPQTWRVTSRDGRYAQVALPGRTFPKQIGERDLDRPFRVIGKFADGQIAELISYVRSSPKKPPIPDGPDGTSYLEFPDQLEGHLPVVQVERVNTQEVNVWVASSSHTGQRAELEYRNGKWHIRNISSYIV